MKNLRFISDRQRRLTIIFVVVLAFVLSSLLVAAKSGAKRASAAPQKTLEFSLKGKG